MARRSEASVLIERLFVLHQIKRSRGIPTGEPDGTAGARRRKCTEGCRVGSLGRPSKIRGNFNNESNFERVHCSLAPRSGILYNVLRSSNVQFSRSFLLHSVTTAPRGGLYPCLSSTEPRARRYPASTPIGAQLQPMFTRWP